MLEARPASSSLQAPFAARWMFAVKPRSWMKLLAPLVLGQALGVTARFDWWGLVAGVVYTMSGLVFIVLLNDWADREVDALKRKMFARQCSPKTIPDGILPAQALLRAGVVAGVACALAALASALLPGRPGLAWLGLVGVGLFVAYTLPPLRLNYRGGGELLEMLGVGVVLPCFNAYAQGGQLLAARLWPLGGWTLLALASAVASGLSDEQSDRAGGKRTVATLWGNRVARRVVQGSVLLGACAWLGGALVADPPGVWVVLPSVSVLVMGSVALWRIGPAARTNAFAAQARYKGHLHRAIWYAAWLLAVMWIVRDRVL